MTLELNDKEIEAICYAYTKLHFDYLLDHDLQPKPKAKLMEAIKTLGIIMDRCEKRYKDEAISGKGDHAVG